LLTFFLYLSFYFQPLAPQLTSTLLKVTLDSLRISELGREQKKTFFFLLLL
jgi:hypothetical protein